MNSKEKIDRFREKFRTDYGEGHFHFACHAAFPVGFTVDLLYQLWANFKDQPQDTIDRLAVSDLLQSDLCRTTQRGIFEMELDVRNELLGQLRTIFGPEREHQLARFLYQYADAIQLDNIPVSFRDTQKLIALGTLAPNLAVEKLAQDFNQQLEKGHRPEVYRLDGLLEALLKQHQDFKNLRHFSQGVKEAFSGENLSENQIKEAFGKVIKINPSLAATAEGVRITLPENLRDKVLNYRREINQQSEVEALKRIKLARQESAKELDLSKLGLIELPEALFGLSQLISLDLFGNALAEIPAAIAQLSQLERLMASQNQITTLPQSMVELKRLRTLKLDSNQLKAVPELIFSLSQLQDLSLENNGIEFLPPEIAQLPQLRLLDLRGNPVWNIPQARKKFTKGYLQEIWRPMGLGASKQELIFLVSEGEGLSMVDPIQQAIDQGAIEAQIISFSTLDELYNLCRENAPHEVVVHLNFSNTASENLEIYFGESPVSISLFAFHQLLTPLQNLRCVVNPQVLSELVAGKVVTENVRSLLCSTGFSRGADPEASMAAFYSRLAEGQSLVYATGSEPVTPDFEWFPNEQFAGIAGWAIPVYKAKQKSKAETGIDIEQFKEQLREFISKDQIENVFNQVRMRLREGSSILDTFVLLRARFNNLEVHRLEDTISEDDYVRQNNQIVDGILQAINEIPPNDLTQTTQQIQPRNANEISDLTELKHFWKELLANDLDALFENIRKSLKSSAKIFSAFINLNSEFTALERNVFHSTISTEERNVTYNQIIHSLIELINGVDASDLNPGVLVDAAKKVNHPDPIRIFLSYAEADQRLAISLKKELEALNLANVEVFDPSEVIAQKNVLEEAENTIVDKLHEAPIAIAIISADYLASEYCRQELQTAARLADEKKTSLIPVIYRPCAWQKLPELAKRQVLPEGGKPLNMVKDLDGAILGVAVEIGAFTDQLIKQRQRESHKTQRFGLLNMPDRPRLYLALNGRSASQKNSQLSQIYLQHLSNQAIDWEVEQNARESGLLTKLNLYQDQLVWFHLLREEMQYSQSVLEDDIINYSSVFDQLIEALYLKLVILDQTVRREEVAHLLQAGIPAVMVCPVDDKDEGQFLKTFYEKMAHGNSLQKSWKDALSLHFDFTWYEKLLPFIQEIPKPNNLNSLLPEGIYVSDDRIAEWQLVPPSNTESSSDELSKQLTEALLQLNFVKQKQSYSEQQRRIQHPISIIQGRAENAPGLLLKNLIRISDIGENAQQIQIDLSKIDAKTWEKDLLDQLAAAMDLTDIEELSKLMDTFNRLLASQNLIIIGRDFNQTLSKNRIGPLKELFELFIHGIEKTPNRLFSYMLSEQSLPDLHKLKNPNLIALATIDALERPDLNYWLESQAKNLPKELIAQIQKEINDYFYREKSMPIRTFIETVARLSGLPRLVESLLNIEPLPPHTLLEQEPA
ncbi:MAG: hypothetical protein DHS20C18_49370 [Saprospiraceae bacterium]|nr:MAG: hypothetical protein DHS20C18_49370 [Saprospiraceae bacterium]